MRSIVTVSALSGATVLAGAMLAMPSAFSDVSKNVNTSVTVAESCSLETTGESTEYSATVQPGSVTEITGSTLKALCNDVGGLAVYAVGFGDDVEGVTDMIWDGDPNYNITSGTETTGNFSKWAMKLTSGTGSPTIENEYNNYSEIPKDQTKVLSYASSTSGTAGVQATAKYRVYASGSQVAGTFVGKVKYTVVHPESAPAPEPEVTWETMESMQQMTPEICASQTTPAAGATTVPTKELYDERDGTFYSIAKLADGNCWMTQNLALGSTEESIKLTSANSDVTSDFDLPASSTSWTTSSYSTPNVYVDANGGYYNWDAATAGTGRELSNINDEAPGSICPKGWKLPKATVDPDNGEPADVNGSFYHLWKNYALPNDWDEEGYYWYNEDYASSFASSPLSLVFSGFFDQRFGGVYAVGVYGIRWSSTVYDSEGAFGAYVDSDGYVSPVSLGGARLIGTSVRCVALGE